MYLKFFLHQKDDVRELFENHQIANAKAPRAAHNNTVQTQSGPGGREGEGERRRRQFRRIFRCSHSPVDKGGRHSTLAASHHPSTMHIGGILSSKRR
jgi:hypothetical protein